ncbi:myotonin-protein kinase-like, partial [Phasianus colchicus]|uniref:myotonin-protein kinase-like n=1 Tax=Phasianus colchicus TaxID=9054 RepID=UPI00129D3EDA
MLRALETPGGSYGREVDWWALGVLGYEMFYGRAPFYAPSLAQTYANILSFQDHLSFPPESGGVPVPPAARSLLGSLLCERDRRLGRGGERDFWDQPLFEGLQWDRLRQQEAPFAPISYGAADTSNFDLPEGGSGATVRDLGSAGS